MYRCSRASRARLHRTKPAPAVRMEELVSKRAKIITGVIALVVLVAVGAGIALSATGGGPQIDVATVEEQELGVNVTASGKLDSGQRADVYPPTAGTLAEVLVSDGATVTAGAVIARLDTRPLEIQLAQAEAGLAQARAALSGVDDQAPSSADIAAAQAGVTAAKSAYDAAKVAYNNAGAAAPSASSIAAAKAAADAAKTAYDIANAAYMAAKAAYEASATPTPAALAALNAAKLAADQAYAAYLGALSSYQQLLAYSPGPARAQAKAAMDQAWAAYKSAQAQLSKLQNADFSSGQASGQAAVDSAEQAVALAQYNLDNAELVAPITGTVFFNPTGAPVADGTTPKPADGAAVSPQFAPFTVSNLQGLTFTAEVDEADVERLAPGQPAIVRLDSFPGEEFSTTVLLVRKAAQQTATGGTIFPVELPLAATTQALRIGMKGDCEIEVSSVSSAIVIPVEALFDENGQTYVYVVEDGVLKRVDVEVGATTDTQVEIVSGIEPGQQVALSGPTEYTEGLRVQVKP